MLLGKQYYHLPLPSFSAALLILLPVDGCLLPLHISYTESTPENPSINAATSNIFFTSFLFYANAISATVIHTTAVTAPAIT